jgi:hypothetical protein
VQGGDKVERDRIVSPSVSEKWPKDGNRYIVTSEFETIVMVQFFAPFSDGERRVLPAELEFSIWGNPQLSARAVSARPLEPQRWERQLVSNENRQDELYGGYGLTIMLADLKAHCQLLQH